MISTVLAIRWSVVLMVLGSRYLVAAKGAHDVNVVHTVPPLILTPNQYYCVDSGNLPVHEGVQEIVAWTSVAKHSSAPSKNIKKFEFTPDGGKTIHKSGQSAFGLVYPQGQHIKSFKLCALNEKKGYTNFAAQVHSW